MTMCMSFIMAGPGRPLLIAAAASSAKFGAKSSGDSVCSSESKSAALARRTARTCPEAVFICMCTYAYLNVIYMCTCVYMYTYTCIQHVCLHISISMYIYICLCIYI